MKSKKVCSFILMCAMVFGAITFIQSQISTAYAMTDEHVVWRWYANGEKDLSDDIRLGGIKIEK